MARVQVGYDPRAEALQTTAAPNIQTVQARVADPNASRAYQLAAALGAPSVQQGLDALGQKVQVNQANADKKDDAAGESWANSRTVEELGRAIQDKTLLPSQSPAFVAAASHTYGQNAVNELANATISKMNRGELKFNDQASLEKYLVEERNKLLAGRDEYATAGFDRGWGRVRESILDANNKVLDRNFVDDAVQQASESMRSVYDTAKREGVSSEELVQRAMTRYGLLKDTKVLINPQVQKEALKGLALTLANDGNKDALDRLLYSNLPNNGPSVRAFLGDQDSLIIERNAQATFEKNQRDAADAWLSGPLREASDGTLNEEKFRQEATEKFPEAVRSGRVQSIINQNRNMVAAKAREISQLEQNIIEARERDAAVAEAYGAIAGAREVQAVTTPSGRRYSAQELGQVAMEKFLSENKQLTAQEVVRRYSQAGIKNDKWERSISVAINNIGEVNIGADRKPIGQLLPATLEALDQFRVIRQVSEPYARSLAGGDRNYATLDKIEALRQRGIEDVNLAAALVNQKNRRNMPSEVMGRISNQVSAEVDSIVNPGVTSRRFWSEVVSGRWGEGRNLLAVKRDVQELAETFMTAGVANTPEEAVQAAGAYYADERISVLVKNSIYLRKDLPELPETKGKLDPVKWFGKAVDGLVRDEFMKRGMAFNANDIVLVPQDGGNRPYMATRLGVPTGIFITREEMVNWIMSEVDKEDAATAEAQSRAKVQTVRPAGRGAHLSPEERARRRAAGQ